jgi:DNA-binding HxlR family transcriptional regulator
VKRTDQKSRCAVNFSLEAVGDPWALLVVRDIVFYGKRTFGEFMASEERITTSVLTDRLTALIARGVLTKTTSPDDRRREVYSLTEKGLALIPVLVGLADWGFAYGEHVRRNRDWIAQSQTDKAKLCRMIRETIQAGGSVFNGGGSVIEQLQRTFARRNTIRAGVRDSYLRSSGSRRPTVEQASNALTLRQSGA